MAESTETTLETTFEPPPAGKVSQWVDNARALQRPLVVAVVIVGLEIGLTRGIWDGALNFHEWLTAQLAIVGPVIGFLFGERAALKKGGQG